MELRDLKIFHSVAQTHSLSRTAQALGYVQSNVSARIRRLEEELQTTLLYRHAKGVHLTPDGNKLWAYARQFSQLEQDMLKELAARPVMEGKLFLGSIESTASTYLPVALQQIMTEHPRLHVSLTISETKDLVQQVLAYELDGAFVVGNVDHSYVTSVPVLQESLALITPLELSLSMLQAPGDAPTLLVLKEGCIYRQTLLEWFRNHQLFAPRIMECASLDTIIELTKAGMGVSLLSQSYLQRRDRTQGISTHILEAPYQEATAWFVYRNDNLQHHSLQAFLDIFAKQP